MYIYILRADHLYLKANLTKIKSEHIEVEQKGQYFADNAFKYISLNSYFIQISS